MSKRPPSEFERRVYRAVRRVPRGRVTTYGLLARHLRCGSARSVGQALKRNPFAPEVPCHRVIASDLSLGGFRGRRDGPAVASKAALLKGEGVKLTHDRLTDTDQLYAFERTADPAGAARRGGHVVREGTRG